MLTVELSNHPGDMLNDASRQREAAGKRALSRYEDELAQYRARVQAVRVKRDRARAQHRWGAWLRLAFAAWTSKRRVPRRPVLVAGPTDTEERLKAGIAGEQLVAVELGRALDDDWTLLRGYRNRRGQPVTVQRMVILAHRRSRIGHRRRPTVLVGTSTDDLLTLIGDSPGRPLAPRQRSEIQRLIQHDHALHNKQRHDKRRRTGPRPRR